MMTQLLKRFVIDAPIKERQATATGGHKWVVIGTRKMQVDVEIDMQAVGYLASRAASAKSKRSKSGPVIGKARELK